MPGHLEAAESLILGIALLGVSHSWRRVAGPPTEIDETQESQFATLRKIQQLVWLESSVEQSEFSLQAMRRTNHPRWLHRWREQDHCPCEISRHNLSRPRRARRSQNLRPDAP